MPSPRRRPRSPISLAATTLTLLLALLLVAPAANAEPALRGLQLHSLWTDTPEGGITRELDISRDLGANVVRLDVGWSSLETEGKGEYSEWYVKKLDQFVNDAHSRGIKTIITLMQTPCWASSAPESLKQNCDGQWWDRGVTEYPPVNPADYGDIAKWVTARYGTKLAALEVWNEPNLPEPRFWRSNDPVGDYAALVKAAYAPAKAGNADVPVIVGALGAADAEFLEKLYAHGIKGFYDGISIHPYNEWRDPEDDWQDKWKKYTLIPGTKWVRETQKAHGDDKPLWLTELGWSSCTGMNWCVSEQQQALYTAKAVELLARVPYVEAYTFYDLRNEGHDRRRMDDNFGIVDYAYNPKPVYQTLKQAWGGGGSWLTGGAGGAGGAGSGSGTGTADPSNATPQVGSGAVTVTPTGIAPVPVNCPATATRCEGKITIITKPIRSRSGGKKKAVRLGARNVRIKGGGSKMVRISIPKRHRPLLRKLKNVKVVVTITSTSEVAAASARKRKQSLTLRCSKLWAPAR